MIRPLAALLWLALSGPSCLAAEAGNGASAPPMVKEHGDASYYANMFDGRTTANGERFEQDKLTAASKTLPLGTEAKVTNRENGRSVDVKINDRGPYVDGRIIDLSRKAAKKLKMEEQGVAPVTVVANPKDQPTRELKEKVRKQAEKKRARQEAARGGRRDDVDRQEAANE